MFRASWVTHAAVGCAVATGGVLDYREDVQGRPGQRLGLEEIGGEDSLRLTAQERRPGGVVALGRGADAVLLEDVPHGGGGDRDATDDELAVDAPISLGGVFTGEPQHQSTDGTYGARSTGTFGAGGLGVAAAKQVAVPAQQCVGGDDQLESTKLSSGEAVQERGEQRAVRPGEARLIDLPLQHSQLMAQRQDFSVLVAVAHRQEPDQGENARQGQVRQSQQHRTILVPTGAGPAVTE